MNETINNNMHQYLISFQQKTYVLNNIPSPFSFQSSSWKWKTKTNSTKTDTNNEFPTLISILQRTLSQKLNLIPSKPFATSTSASTILPLKINIKEITTHITYINASFKNTQILGGKGGFGTLLKGQSKQAPNKVTLNFNACRDLNGRRLRFVNEELKMRALNDDASKNYNASGWYLDMVPNWSGVSTKAMRRNEIKRKRDMEEVRKRLEGEKVQKERKKRENESKVMSYVNYEDNDMNMMNNTNNNEDTSMEQIVLQGLLKKRKKLKEEEEENTAKTKTSLATTEEENNNHDKEQINDNDNDNDNNKDACTAPWLGILAGEIQQINNANGENNSNMMHLRSTSDFATGCILLPPTPHNPQNQHTNIIYYYEITLKTSGSIQFGWTLPSFSPKTINDGIGDDEVSYGYDGSRQLLFHNNNEIPYNDKNTVEKWKEGDVIGSYYNPVQKIIGYYKNGMHLGIAFDNMQVTDMLYPAFSLNLDEEIEIFGNMDEDCCLYCPKDCTPVQNIINGSYCKELEMLNKNKNLEASIDETTSIATTTSTAEETIEKTSKKELSSSQSTQEEEKEKTNIIIDLNNYSSLNELLHEKYGLEILKYNLQILGCKCGGTLEERCKRLFSLKGLEYKDYPRKVLAKK